MRIKLNTFNQIHAFGMEMNGRKWQGTANDYRFGMNTQEKNSEIYQGAYGAMYWEYDSRIGRRWNLDPKGTIGVSDYACFLNSPIQFTDPDGDIVKYENAKAFFKIMGKVIVDKEFRAKWQEQRKATRTTVQVKIDDDGTRHERNVSHPQVFRYTYNKQSGQTLEEGADVANTDMADRTAKNLHSSNNVYAISFSDKSENMTIRGTGHPLERGGPKQKSSTQSYKSGVITITTMGTFDENNSKVTFFHGSKPIKVNDEGETSISIPAIGNNPNSGSSMKTSISFPFEGKTSAKIKMVVTSENKNSKGDPGAILLKASISR